MVELIRTIVLAAFGITLALFSIFGLTYEPAAAPSDPVPVKITEDASKSATTTPEVVSIATTTPSKATSTPAKTAPKPKPQPKVEAPGPTPVAEVIETITTPPIQEPVLSPSNVNEKVRAALVNIICVSKTGGMLNSISASGVLIDPRGVVLTNAHVAQYFLLKNYSEPNFVECSIRTGSPAVPRYTAELLFLPPAWIQKNAHKIDDENPTGNGEHDYALIRITGTVNAQTALPSAFNYLEVALDSPTQGETALVAGYPAGFLGGITIAKELYQASSLAMVRELYTFDTDTADLFSIGGSIVAQQGSSGGAAANDDGILVGLIVTSTQAADTASRDLRAIATSYVVRDFEKEAGLSLASFLSWDLASRAHQFALGIAPTLTQTLVNVLEGN